MMVDKPSPSVKGPAALACLLQPHDTSRVGPLSLDPLTVVYVVDARANRLVYLSPSFESVWGEHPAAIMADVERWTELLHPDDRDHEIAVKQSIYAKAAEPITGSYRIVRPDGSIRRIQDTAIPIRNSHGRLTTVVGLARDVTDAERSQPPASGEPDLASLAWTTLLQQSPYGIGLFSPDGVCLRIGAALERLNGLPEAEHLGKVIWDLAPGLRSTVQPIFEKIRRDLQPVTNVEISGHPAHLNGAFRRSRCSYVPLVQQGALVAVIALVHDVTDEKLEQEAAAALREREVRARLALRAAGLVPWEIEPASGRIKADERLLDLFGVVGPMPDTMQPFVDRIHPEDRESVLQNFRRATEPGGNYSARFRVLHPGKGVRWLVGAAESFMDADGRLKLIGYNGDITDEVISEEQRNLLSGELVHRTKNIISVVGALAHLTADTSDDVGEFVSAFDGRLRSISVLYDSLHQAKWRGLTLADLARESLAHLAGVDHRVRVGGPDVTLSTQHCQKLSLILYELATNSLKYGALSVPRGYVRFRWSARQDGRVFVLWSEHGGPIPDPRKDSFGSKMIKRLTGSTGGYRMTARGPRWWDHIENASPEAQP